MHSRKSARWTRIQSFSKESEDRFQKNQITEHSHRCQLHTIARNDDNPLNKNQLNGNIYRHIIEAAEARNWEGHEYLNSGVCMRVLVQTLKWETPTVMECLFYLDLRVYVVETELQSGICSTHRTTNCAYSWLLYQLVTESSLWMRRWGCLTHFCRNRWRSCGTSHNATCVSGSGSAPGLENR